MFYRNILSELEAWKTSTGRKPLILRGARQVGKTTIVNLFSSQYKQYIYLNLERKEEAEPFRNFIRFDTLVETIFFIKDQNIQERDTLLFIDEIQAVPEAINLLRYFYEDYPWLHVIAAGSLLETIMREEVSVPVGRVEYKVMRPVTFSEFLAALGEEAALKQLTTVPVQEFAHEKLLYLFHRYTLIGGMPEVVQNYALNQNMTALLPIYESLQESFLNDVEKYARNNKLVYVIRHVIKSMSFEAGNRIKFQHFGQSNYGSKEVGEALRIIEKAMLLNLVYPTTNVILPILPDRRKSPRLHLLDTGLMNFVAGLQKDLISLNDLHSLYQGKIAEQIVGQEILATKFNVMNELHFWVREKPNSTAEVDFVTMFDGKMIPIEVKSGETGRLRSLHLFMDQCTHQTALRLYSGKLKKDVVRTQEGKEYTLLSLPYYLAGQIDQYLTWLDRH
ncbi:MAG: ATP-binding protein [Saprospiraceae bacterium]